MSVMQEKTKTFTNVYGETIAIKLNSEGKVTILHSDCNDNFEPILDFMSKYVLTQEEVKQISRILLEFRIELKLRSF